MAFKKEKDILCACKRMRTVIILMVFLFPFSSVFSNFLLDLETGPLFWGYNNIRVPNKNSMLTTVKSLNTSPQIFFRLRFIYTIKKRHHLEILWAPLSVQFKGKLKDDFSFQDKIFSAHEPLSLDYQFNSYRFGYAYDFLSRKKIAMGIGLTFKIRDASIKVSSSQGSRTEANVGFVPLIRLRLLWKFSPMVHFIFEGDALGAPQGRAEDFLFAFLFRLSPHVQSKLGYRILEGGVNVKSIFNEAMLHCLVFGINFRL